MTTGTGTGTGSGTTGDLIFSNGPDCLGNTNCCCDVCTHDKISCIGKCCRCVPRWLLAVFTPDVVSGSCALRGIFVSHEGEGSYIINLEDLFPDFFTLLIGIQIYKDEATGTGSGDGGCYWRVTCEDLGIAELYRINGTDYTCSDLDITLALTAPGSATGCSGTLSISRYDLSKVPFYAQDPTTYQRSFPFACGSCLEVCNELCVTYSWDGTAVRKTFEWNASEERWEYGLTDYLLPTTNGATCELTVLIAELSSLIFSPVTLTTCYQGLDVSLEDQYNNVTVRISCGPCTCWKYICETCRCVCNTLCAIYAVGGNVQLLELPWVADLVNGGGSWTDGSIELRLSRSGTNNPCVIIPPTLSGSGPQFETLTLEDCPGTDLQFTFDNGVDSFLYAACKEGPCFNGPSYCCDATRLTQDMPLSLTVTATDGGGCSCATGTFTLVWNPFASHWKGYGVLGCSLYNPLLITLTVSCVGTVVLLEVSCGTDGLGNPQVIQPTVSYVGSVMCNPFYRQFNFILDRSCCNDEPMAGGTIVFTITE